MAEAAKIVITEEAPALVNITGLPTAVTGLVGVTERGPVGVATLSTSWNEWVDIFGGFTASADAAVGAYGFFLGGGQELWTVRTCHYTDITDTSTLTAVAATYTIQNAGTTATAASTTSSLAGPYTLVPADTLLISIDGAGATTVTFDAAAGTITDTTAYPCADQDGLTSIITVDGGTAQTVTFSGATTTAASIVSQMNTQLTGCSVEEIGGQVKITSDKKGTDSSVAAAAGTGGLTWAAAVAGTGDVADIAAVTATEVASLIDADLTPDTSSSVASNYVTVATVDTGSTATLQFTGGTARTKIGFDNTLHAGIDAGATNTLKIDAKTPGTFGNLIRVVIAASSSTVASEFDLKVEEDGVIKEVWKNLTMDDTAARFVETIINDTNSGSNLIAATDLDAGGTPTTDRPINGTHGYLTSGNDGLSGLADTDFVGSSAGPTGLYALDTLTTLRIVVIPAKATSTVYSGINTYCETWREKSCFGIYATPTAASVANTAAMKTFIETTTSIKGTTEYGAIYWPRIKVSNPSTAVFGTASTMYVDPSAWIAGTYARVDDTISGGVYEAPAGVEQNMGRINGCLGLEVTEVNDLRKREILAGALVNPIRHHPSYGYYIDGHWTLKDSGNWPDINEVRGKIHIAESVSESLEWVKHRRNTKALRKRVFRSVTSFLMTQLALGAFASDVPSEAFFLQCDDKLNPPAVVASGKLKIKIGLNFGKAIGVVEQIITKDTRAYDEALAS